MSEQRTPEWHAERAGKFTGSRFDAVLARKKTGKDAGKPLKAYDDLIWQLVVERMTGQAVESVDSYSMKWGRDVEPYAREAYEIHTGNFVTESGFIVHPEFAFAGASPDGLIDDDGGLELKCPKDPAVHLARFLDGIPEEYVPQVQGCMWVTNRQWWDFVSYDPRMPESHRMLIIKVERDQEYIDRLQAAVIEAEARVVELCKQLERKAA